MNSGDNPRITKLLNEVRAGNHTAEAELITIIYPELRKIAARQIRREHRPGHTLQPTALVHEAYVRLAGQNQIWQNRSHFFAVAAHLMHAILVDYARKRQAAKRGGSSVRIDFEGATLAANASPDFILDVDRALEKLASWDPRQAKVVVFRFFGGLSEDEIAEVLSVSVRTVKRDWQMAKAWLHGELRDRPSEHNA